MSYFASEETKKIKLGSGIEIEVRADISKKLFNKLISAIPQNIDSEKGISISQASDFSSVLFNTFVVAWSLDREPTVENYFELKREYADEIDEALGNHFTSLTVTEKESRKS
jgi:hypothetical protein